MELFYADFVIGEQPQDPKYTAQQGDDCVQPTACCDGVGTFTDPNKTIIGWLNYMMRS